MLEGKSAFAAVFVLGAVIALVERLPTAAGAIVYAAVLIGAVKVVGGSVRSAFRRLREVHEAVTSDLPDRMEKVEERLEEGERHFTAIDASLETMANVERARVQGWAEASRRPRPSRSTDPDPEEERRVYAFAPWDEDGS